MSWGNRGAKRGDANPRSKLTEAQVLEIKARLRRGERQKDIAPLYGLTAGYVQKIASGDRWGWLVDRGTE